MTTSLYSNGYLLGTQSIPNINALYYTHLNTKVYSATMVDRVYGVFVSDVIQATSAFLKWNKLSWNGQVNLQTKVFMFVRAASTKNGLGTSPWIGPYQNGTNDISTLNEPYLQFMVVLRNDAYAHVSYPMVNWINVSFFSSQASVQFFTKAFDIGFIPKHVLLTYNASNATDETVIRFAVSGEDTADTSRYQYINPNKIETLGEIPYDSHKIKVMLELIGASSTHVSIDEFAIMLGGDGAFLINKPTGTHGIGQAIIGSTFVVGN